MLYPLKFKPILKSKIWGGKKLKTLLNKATESVDLGESWEISTVDGNISVIENGLLKGSLLTDVIANYGEDLVGKQVLSRFGKDFPLLIKYIDASQNLSIQVHPDDETAMRLHKSKGKTEMWYVMDAEPESNLIVGFKSKVDKEKYLDYFNANKIEAVVNFEPVSEGDAFFIEAGRIHAIGQGVLLAEIQQTSDITYRVFDWNRLDSNGDSRELHTDLALDAFKFDLEDNYKLEYTAEPNIQNELINSRFFKTNIINLSQTVSITNTYDSFIIYMCVKGSASIVVNSEVYELNYGETILIPSCITNFAIQSKSAKLLEVYI